MRVEIPTGGEKIVDSDIRALYIIREGLNTASKRMIYATLVMFADKMGYHLVRKDGE